MESVVALLLVHVRVTLCPAVIEADPAVRVTVGAAGGGELFVPGPAPQPANVSTSRERIESNKIDNFLDTESPFNVYLMVGLRSSPLEL